jgi:hypothetical protein
VSEKMLVKKLANVMKQVKYIEKKGFNKFNKYKYATESDVAEKVREVLAEQNVIMLPDVVEHTTREHVTRNGNTEYIATVKVKFTFIDGDTGEELSIHSSGEGQDSGDKAVYKAITGAQKYALMKAFMIPTGDDPEADNTVDERNNGQGEQEQPNLNNQITLLVGKALPIFKGSRAKLSNAIGKSQEELSDLFNSNNDAAKKVIVEKLEGIINDHKQAG